MWMGPARSSFAFMNSSRCKRALENPMGDVDYKPVAEGNMHASVAAFLYALACLRGILPIVENPEGSSICCFLPCSRRLHSSPLGVLSAAAASLHMSAWADDSRRRTNLLDMPGSGISARLASARVVCAAHWSTGSYDMARSTHLGGRSYYENMLLTRPGWGSLYSACGRSMDLHPRHQAAQDGSTPWLIRRPRSDR